MHLASMCLTSTFNVSTNIVNNHRLLLVPNVSVECHPSGARLNSFISTAPASSSGERPLLKLLTKTCSVEEQAAPQGHIQLSDVKTASIHRPLVRTVG
jgi:hypothetical protein